MKFNKKSTKNLTEILTKFSNFAIEEGYDDLAFIKAELVLYDKNNTRINKELSKKWFAKEVDEEPKESINDRLDRFEDDINSINYKLGQIVESLKNLNSNESEEE